MLLTCTAGKAVAQQAGPEIPDGKALGVTVDRFMVPGDEDSYTTFTVHVTHLKAGGLSPDLGVALFPTQLPLLQVVTLLDGAVGFNISLPRVTLLPHAGASSLFGAAPWGPVAAAVGFHVGLSILINFRQTDAIRLDLTRREYFRNDNQPTSNFTIGIGISSVQPRKRDGTP